MIVKGNLSPDLRAFSVDLKVSSFRRYIDNRKASKPCISFMKKYEGKRKDARIAP